MQFLKDQFPGTIYLFEHFFFRKIGDEEIAAAERGSDRNNAREEELGRTLFAEFLEQRLPEVEWSGDGRGGFYLNGKLTQIRMRPLFGDVTIRPTFDLRLSERQLERPADLYVLAGFCEKSGYAYLFGWISEPELDGYALRYDQRFPSKSVSLEELHPMQELPEFFAPAEALAA